MILVTGATGHIGSEVVRQLVAKGEKVRALAHHPEKAQEALGPGVEVVAGDFDDVQSLDAAMQGVDKVFLLSPSDPRQVEQQGNVVEAAKRAGVKQLVKLSVVGAAPDAPAQLMRWHAETEKQIKESGVPYTILRPHVFFQYWLYLAPTINQTGTFYAALKRDMKLAAVDTRDIAAVAVAVLTEPGHENKTYEITGSEGISNDELAAAISEVSHRPVTYTELPADYTKAGMLQLGMPQWFVDTVVGMDEAYSTGNYCHVTDVVEKVTGKKPRTASEFIGENADAFHASGYGT